MEDRVRDFTSIFCLDVRLLPVPIRIAAQIQSLKYHEKKDGTRLDRL